MDRLGGRAKSEATDRSMSGKGEKVEDGEYEAKSKGGVAEDRG